MSYGAPNFTAVARVAKTEPTLAAELAPIELKGWKEGRNFRAPRLSPDAVAAAEASVRKANEQAERLLHYSAALHAADWHYELATGDSYRAGREQFRHLYAEQAEIDPSGAIWVAIAPSGFAIPQPRVQNLRGQQ